MSTIGFTSNLTSVFCRRVYLKGKCDCLFCHQIKEYYLCLSELEKACCSEQKFKSFKSLCKHFEQFTQPIEKTPKRPVKSYKKFIQLTPRFVKLSKDLLREKEEKTLQNSKKDLWRAMTELFRKVLIHNGRARKTYYLCKCLVKGKPSITPELQEGDSEIVCNIKLSTFKGLIRHLVRKHKIYLPNSIVCESCEIVLPNTCLAI